MLQNRVDPTGKIIFTPERGAWMGNRGVIHNGEKRIIKPYVLKTWITCALQFKGRHREVMAKGRYTELFFLDEATAFSAGHRPCAECRREDYNLFKAYWLKGNVEQGFNTKTPIGKIDEIIHQERIGKDKEKLTHKESLSALPDGAFVLLQGTIYLKKGNHLYKWSPAGYSAPEPLPGIGDVDVLTPRSIVNAFRAGYVPQMALMCN
jgi:hypothetical protein